MSQWGRLFCKHFGFSARIGFQRSGSLSARQTRDTWRKGTDVDNSASNLLQCSIGTTGGVVNVRDGSMHGVRGANYVGADGAHMRRASAWCVDKHGTGSGKLTTTHIPVVGMVRKHGHE